MRILFMAIVLSATLLSAQSKQAKGKSMQYEVATLGSGCFWCVEAVFQRLEGVATVESGYSGGSVVNPTYEQVCTGRTGHAEVAQITFDPNMLSYKELLEVFFRTHDPTTLNKQGNDAGTQYRSAIFYHTDEQKKVAEEALQEAQPIWDNKIVTEISPLINYYKAENYHQNYYNSNQYQPYCMLVINPKLSKFKKEFQHKLKKGE